MQQCSTTRKFLLFIASNFRIPVYKSYRSLRYFQCCLYFAWEGVYCWCSHQHAQSTGSPFQQWLLPFQRQERPLHAQLAKRCCYCWVWSTERCPVHTQCLSWWAGSGPPRRSASDRLHTWSTPDGKPCPGHASSSQTLWSSSRRKHRDRPDQKAWRIHQHEYREEEKHPHHQKTHFQCVLRLRKI